jgi:hypothetical protein
MNITKHITLTEATKSNTATRLGINNTPNEATIETMKITAEKVFEPLREILGAIRVSSFYRSPDLNRAIGGSKSSQHCKGEAIDMQAIHVSNKRLFEVACELSAWDQIIWEFGNDTNPDWVHISFSKRNRKQILRARKINGATIYEPMSKP